MNESLGDEGDGLFTRQMTVAHVREPPGTDHVEVMFNESARFYRLPRESPSFEDSLRLPKEAGGDVLGLLQKRAEVEPGPSR